MARYTGPRSKISRRFGEHIFGHCKQLTQPRPDSEGKVSHRQKNYPPGSHGKGRRRKPSVYAEQLKEKQKVKYLYGLLERQFRRVFKKADRKKGITGDNLLQLLEARLDNTVYRLGIAPTRRGARQMVSHKHITVNGEVANIPSLELRPGDIVAVRERSKSLQVIGDSLRNTRVGNYPWLEWDHATKSGKFMQYPDREDLRDEVQIREQLIVELYSK